MAHRNASVIARKVLELDERLHYLLAVARSSCYESSGMPIVEECREIVSALGIIAAAAQYSGEVDEEENTTPFSR